MSLYQIAIDHWFLRRNNKVMTRLHRDLEGSVLHHRHDDAFLEEEKSLKYNGWHISLDHLNEDEMPDRDGFFEDGSEADYWYHAEHDSKPPFSRRCKCYRHLLNSIKKYCG